MVNESEINHWGQLYGFIYTKRFARLAALLIYVSQSHHHVNSPLVREDPVPSAR